MSEVIDKNHVLPHRMFAMIHTVNTHPNIPRAELLRLLQPAALNESLETSGNIFVKCQLCGLIAEKQDKSRAASLIVDPVVATDLSSFRMYMQATLTGATRDDQDHAVLNLFAAWFAVQNEQIINTSKSEWEIRFHMDLYPHRSERVISEHPGITAWMEWAEFMGWGWQLKFGSQESSVIPDSTIRIQPLLPQLLPEVSPISFGEFMNRLAVSCPELDGGVLFERCWEASRPNERRGNRLSLMLSTALRVLNQQGRIVLENRADATENWMLFPAQSYLSRVTHIYRGKQQ